MPMHGGVVPVAIVVAALMAVPTMTRAQSCFGQPSRGGVAYENVRYSVGQGHGVSGSTGGRFVLGAAVNTRKAETGFTEGRGYDGGARIAFGLPVSRLMICPGLRLGYGNMSWDVAPSTELTVQTLSLRAGAGIGLEQHVYRGVSIIPSIGAHYDYTVIKYDIAAPEGENETTGDTLSRVAIVYSIALRYRFAYVGAAALRYSDDGGGRPYQARLFLGFAFGSSTPSGAVNPMRRLDTPRH